MSAHKDAGNARGQMFEPFNVDPCPLFALGEGAEMRDFRRDPREIVNYPQHPAIDSRLIEFGKGDIQVANNLAFADELHREIAPDKGYETRSHRQWEPAGHSPKNPGGNRPQPVPQLLARAFLEEQLPSTSTPRRHEGTATFTD